MKRIGLRVINCWVLQGLQSIAFQERIIWPLSELITCHYDARIQVWPCTIPISSKKSSLIESQGWSPTHVSSQRQLLLLCVFQYLNLHLPPATLLLYRYNPWNPSNAWICWVQSFSHNMKQIDGILFLDLGSNGKSNEENDNVGNIINWEAVRCTRKGHAYDFQRTMLSATCIEIQIVQLLRQ